MRRKLATVKVLGSVGLVAVAAAAFSSTASAKEIKQAVVCGRAECRTLEGGNGEGSRMEALILGNQNTTPPRPSGFYTIKLVTVEGDSWSQLYVPAVSKVRSMAPIGPQIWWRIPAHDRAIFKEVVAGLEPYPANAFPSPAVRIVAAPTPEAGTSSWSVLWTALAVAFAFIVVVGMAVPWRWRTRARTRPEPSA